MRNANDRTSFVMFLNDLVYYVDRKCFLLLILYILFCFINVLLWHSVSLQLCLPQKQLIN